MERSLRGSLRFCSHFLKLFGAVSLLGVQVLQANPTGEQVVAGAAGFERVGNALTVTQGTDRAVINWNSFSIGAGEITRFVQPSASSAVLNRVITANNPSQIYGTLQANGQVYLINSAGVFVGPGGVVDTAAFVASTRDLGNEEFMRGANLNFTGNSEAAILNQGKIEARQGDVFLIARQVSNEGQIMASDGTVGMVSGTEVALHALGPHNYKVRLLDVADGSGARKAADGVAEVVNQGVIEAANAELAATGNYLSLAIRNDGTVRATGVTANADGSVTLTGGAGDLVNRGVVAALRENVNGRIEGGTVSLAAKNITTDPGSIVTAAGQEKGGEVKIDAKDTVYASGKIEATSSAGAGGRIVVTGERVGLFEGTVDASGGARGGEVLFGGDYLGMNPEIRNAKTAILSSGAVIQANATQNGDGGKVIVWSDEYTGFYGKIFAQGGRQGGDGGFVETSSKDNLQAWGSVDTFAPIGKGGTWLLDPTELYITTTSANVDVTGAPAGPWVYQPTAGSTAPQSQANANTILQALDAGQNVTIQVNTTTGTEDTRGNIIVARPLVVQSGVTAGDLTLIAGGGAVGYTAASVPNPGPAVVAISGVIGGRGGGGIFVNQTVEIGGNLTLIAGNDPGFQDPVTLNRTGGTGGNVSISAPIISRSGVITLQAGWGFAPQGGATGGTVNVDAAVTASGAAGAVIIYGGSANGSGIGGVGTGGGVNINAPVTIGTGLPIDPFNPAYAGSIISGGNGSGSGGNLLVNAAINGPGGTLTLQSGTGRGGAAGSFTINAGSAVGQANSLSTRLAAVFLRSQTTISLLADVYSARIVLVPTPTPTATGPVNNGSIWLNETPIPGLNSYSVDSPAINRLFANLLISDAIEIGDSTFTGDIAIGQAGGVSFSSSNLNFIGSPAAATLNRAISFNASSGTCLSFSPAIPGGKITFDTGGRLFTRFGTAQVDIASSGGTIDFLRVTGIGQTSAQPLRTSVANILGTVSGNVFLANAGALNISGNFNLAANSLNLTAGGDITQSLGAIVTASGASNTLNASGNDVILNNANNFGTVFFASVRNASIADTGAIAFGASTLTGNFTANAGGAITQTGALVVPGTTSVTATAGAITLTQNNDFTGAVTVTGSGAGAISITDANSLLIGSLTQAGAGNVTLAVGSALLAGQTATLTQSGLINTGAGGSFTITGTPNALAFTTIDLSGQNNLISSGSIGINNPGRVTSYSFRNTYGLADADAGLSAGTLTNLENLAIYYGTLAGVGTAALNLPAVTLKNVLNPSAGNLTLLATTVAQAGALVVPGTTSVTATAGNILLTQNNNFTGAVTLVAQAAGANVAVTDGSALNLGGISMTGAGTLGITVGGDLSQSGVITSGTGQVNITSTVAGSSVDLSTQANDFQNAAVTFNSGAVEADILDFKFRNIDAAAGNPAFNFLTSLRNLTLLFDAAGIVMPATTLQTSGGVAGSLVLTGAGAGISQAGALVVPGTTSVTATAGNIALAQNNNFTGAVTLTTAGNGNISVRDLNTLLLGQVTMGSAGVGTLDIETAAGGITQSGSTTISTGTGNVTVQAGTGGVAAAITLANQNDFRGAVTLTGAATQITDANSLTLGTLTTGALTATSTGALNLGAGTVGGALAATSNGGAISQTDAGLNLGSTANFNAGAGSVTMTAGLAGGVANNVYQGNVTLTAGNADFLVAAADGIGRFGQAAGSTIVTGTFTLRSPTSVDFNLANGAGVDPLKFELTSAQLNQMSVGSFTARASGAKNLVVGTFNSPGIQSLNLVTGGTGNISADSITVGTLGISSGGTVSFTEVGGLQNNTIQNLGSVSVASGGFDFQNRSGLNLAGPATMPGRLSLEVAGQFNNQTGLESPFSGVQLGSVIKSLSLVGGLPNSVSGLSGFSYRYDGVMPTSGNVMSFAVPPLTMFAPNGTVIAGVDLGGTQTGGSQLNTFFTGSDSLNWIVSDFGRFNQPAVPRAALEYTLYPQRVEPETRSLPEATVGQLQRELGRPPTVEEVVAREVAQRDAARVRSGAILERSSFDQDENLPQERAQNLPSGENPTEGEIPQASRDPNSQDKPRDYEVMNASPTHASKSSKPSKGTDGVNDVKKPSRAYAMAQ